MTIASATSSAHQRGVQGACEWKHRSGFDEGVKMSQLVSEEQRAKIIAQVDEAVKDGAGRVRAGQVGVNRYLGGGPVGLRLPRWRRRAPAVHRAQEDRDRALTAARRNG